MRRITVTIEDDALARLRAMAERERRDPRDQAAILLAKALGARREVAATATRATR